MASGRGPARRRRRKRSRGRGRGPGRGDGGKRLLVVLGATLLAFLAITGRLVVLQVVDAGSLDQAAARQRMRTISPLGQHPTQSASFLRESSAETEEMT